MDEQALSQAAHSRREQIQRAQPRTFRPDTSLSALRKGTSNWIHKSAQPFPNLLCPIPSHNAILHLKILSSHTMLSSKIFLIFLCYSTSLVIGTRYIVLPKQRKNIAACSATTKFLNDYLGPEGKIEVFGSDILGITQIWIINATSDQAAYINTTEPNVSGAVFISL